jgi:hypothetical protein
MPYPILLYLKRRLLVEALAQLRMNHPNIQQSSEYQQFRARIESTARSVLVYEDAQQQEAARQHIDFDKVVEYAHEHKEAALAKLALPDGTSATFAQRHEMDDRALLVGLMRWFKLDFFKWCNKPQCDNPACRAPPGRMEGAGMVEPSLEEKNIGECYVVRT